MDTKNITSKQKIQKEKGDILICENMTCDNILKEIFQKARSIRSQALSLERSYGYSSKPLHTYYDYITVISTINRILEIGGKNISSDGNKLLKNLLKSNEKIENTPDRGTGEYNKTAINNIIKSSQELYDKILSCCVRHECEYCKNTQ